jgi:hypothetical protein
MTGRDISGHPALAPLPTVQRRLRPFVRLNVRSGVHAAFERSIPAHPGIGQAPNPRYERLFLYCRPLAGPRCLAGVHRHHPDPGCLKLGAGPAIGSVENPFIQS